MPKSRHRKNHKQKVKSFKQSVADTQNREMKKYYSEMKEKQEAAKNSKEETLEQPKRITL
tara:strand:+ start:225 stop:404 length:180 start_codon:yes stop_codon:yes gene_type:complete